MNGKMRDCRRKRSACPKAGSWQPWCMSFARALNGILGMSHLLQQDAVDAGAAQLSERHFASRFRHGAAGG